MTARFPGRGDATVASVLLLLLACVACRGPDAPVGAGAKCRYIDGADACSMVPQRFTCECDGRIVPVAPGDEQPVCGAILTRCQGRVVRYQPVASFADVK